MMTNQVARAAGQISLALQQVQQVRALCEQVAEHLARVEEQLDAAQRDWDQLQVEIRQLSVILDLTGVLPEMNAPLAEQGEGSTVGTQETNHFPARPFGGVHSKIGKFLKVVAGEEIVGATHQGRPTTLLEALEKCWSNWPQSNFAMGRYCVKLGEDLGDMNDLPNTQFGRQLRQALHRLRLYREGRVPDGIQVGQRLRNLSVALDELWSWDELVVRLEAWGFDVSPLPDS